MLYLSYHERNDKDSLHAYASLLGQQSGSCIEIAPELGEGKIHFITLEEGLYTRIWDCKFNQPICLNRQSDNKDDLAFFTLTYFFTPEAFLLHNTIEQDVRVNNIWNTVFLSSNAKFNFEMRPDIPLKCLTICFSAEWLENYNSDNPLQKEFISKMLCSPDPVFFFESHNDIERKMINDIYNSDSRIVNLFFKSRIYNILNEFITKASGRHSLLLPCRADMYEPVIRQVEAKLMEHMDCMLPGLKQLSREFAMSESTLKRNFKRLYGKGIHEYYLQKKMVYAHELISQKNKTVTETAYMLGYEKVSHFISMFKKRIGYCPGTLRKTA